MKRLLFALALLFSIPFSSSCIVEITYKVTVNATDCEYELPHKKATRGRSFVLNITSIREEYVLEQQVDFFWIKIANWDPIYPRLEGETEGGQWIYENNKLTIFGYVVTSDIDIAITARPKYEQK